MDQGSETDLWPCADLVRKAGLIPQDQSPEVRAFSGGVSCVVALVRSGRGAWVVKQALPQLHVKDPWFADRNRIFIEAACLRLIRDQVSGRPAPEVLFEDRETFACILEYAGDGSRSWKQDLMSGRVDPTITRRVAGILAEIHSKTRGNEDVKRRFGNYTNFNQLRLDPYLATTAARHLDLRPQIDEVSSFLADEKVCLVHGDFSPKNILLLPGGRVWVIDCEVAHYGNPVFDIAFCTNHLLLKSIHLGSLLHLKEAQSLWSSYWSGTGFAQLEGEAVRTLSVLMLARVDGKSPAEYLTEGERLLVRNLARSLIEQREESFGTVARAAGDLAGAGRAP